MNYKPFATPSLPYPVRKRKSTNLESLVEDVEEVTTTVQDKILQTKKKRFQKRVVAVGKNQDSENRKQERSPIASERITPRKQQTPPIRKKYITRSNMRITRSTTKK